MGNVITAILTLMIVMFPMVRSFIPQRNEDWLFALSRKDGPKVRFIYEVLQEHNDYFRKLSEQGKLRFIKRLMFLIVRKVVVGYGNLELKPEMAIVALSAQVQLTFGLRRFSLPRFKKIILYPEEFYSRFFGTKLKGLTTGAGFVTLSWKHTLEGFQDSTDNLNLALHEFAHALHIDLLLRESDDVKISKAFDKYGEQIRAHFKRLKPSGQEYLRDYGFSNKQEFFAVCVEHFFESPQEFQSNLSMLYTYFCKMLNQDPLNVYRDYSYEKSI